MGKVIADILELAQELESQQELYDDAVSKYSKAAKEASAICLANEEKYQKQRERDRRRLKELKAAAEDPRQRELNEITRKLSIYDNQKLSDVQRMILSYQNSTSAEYLNKADRERYEARRRDLQESLEKEPAKEQAEITEIESRRYPPTTAELKKLRNCMDDLKNDFLIIKQVRFTVSELTDALEKALNKLSGSKLKPTHIDLAAEIGKHERLLSRITATIEGKK